MVKRGRSAELQMEKMLLMGETVDRKIFACKVLMYDSKKERIYLLLESGMLTEISLDAVYRCQITSGTEDILCNGRIKERYRNEEGEVLELQIENGFYKINIKSVDKQEA